MEEDKAYTHSEVEHSDPDPIEQYFHSEPAWARWIPGGYSQSRCLKLSGKPMLLAILSFAGTCILFFGYDSAVMSQVNINPDYLQRMNINHGTNSDAARVGGLVSFWFAGFFIGAILSGSYADSLGRLRAIQMGCIWGILGGALLAGAQNFTWMAIARIISGVGCGHLNTITPIWTSELADYNLRGAFVAVQYALAIFGAQIVYWMQYGCLKTRSLTFSWRFPLGFQMLFLLVILLVAPFFPETPRHLAQTGRLEDAREVLTRCRLLATRESVNQELEEIKTAIRLEATQASHGFISMMWKKDVLHTRRRVALAMGIQFMRELTGPDVIAVFGPQVFALSGYSGDWPSILAGLNFIGYMCSAFIASYTVERFGRRKLLLTGLFTMGSLLLICGGLAHKVYDLAEVDPVASKRYGSGVVACVFLYTMAFGGTWIVAAFVYPTEVFPLATRAKGSALSMVSFAVAGGVCNEIIPYIISAAGFWVFIIFALLNFVQILPVWAFYIETANRHLEDLDILFASKSPFAIRAEREYDEKKRALGLRESDAVLSG
ncbi:uncharacterized protein TRUGW13939_11851 [Talaromyces rugulosus]|uniref:Major facilitator superfamily (MFS) profile domain-containing protein n=1 Tax=Talaromyces rugulosus TaxID=121627 RepID=A0A7H8RGK4_TALRU|nr:uncharacterized protein TRUGW13939_11851 [Talaromyces rugulosus]QKX64675.1 hypothetical protein TRUGW13939_11851 [Talaromyces rugulosus]